ncbi:MAG: hypothetical protein NW217_07360 [Hyphomicrobiaceae bacterium]|nr:hypothetical protein [Hyphomicrobiaceae bacterium]
MALSGPVFTLRAVLATAIACLAMVIASSAPSQARTLSVKPALGLEAASPVVEVGHRRYRRYRAARRYYPRHYGYYRSGPRYYDYGYDYGYYRPYRRHYSVVAPFVRVRRGYRGLYVRAPFVRLHVPY